MFRFLRPVCGTCSFAPPAIDVDSFLTTKYLLAGTGRSIITPPPGTPQGGWGAQTHQRGTGSDLPFYATALVIADAEKSVAIIDVDSIGFDPEWTNLILDAVTGLSGVKREHIRLSCTHTHSGPNTFRLGVVTEGLDLILQYLKALPLQVAGAVWQAQQNLQPIRIGASSGSCDFNVNRRQKLPEGRVVVGQNERGPVDRTVRVIRIDDLDEKPLATIVHYACHPTTTGWQSRQFTPDYPGMTKKLVEEGMGGTCLFLQGATGDIGPRRGFTGDVSVYRKHGKLLGLEATKLATGIETLPRREKLNGLQESGATLALYEAQAVEPPPASLDVHSIFMKLPLKRLPSPDIAEAEAAASRDDLNRVRREGSEDEIRVSTALAVQAGMRADRARLYHGKAHMDWQLQAIRIGSIALVCIPGEPFTEINAEIVAGSPFSHTLFSGYSNGGFGYLPVRRAYSEGGYEVEISPFAPEAAEIVVDESLRMLNQMFDKMPDDEKGRDR